MKTQKNITISLLALLIQFTGGWIPLILNIPISEKTDMIFTILFWIFGGISSLYALISLVKKEAALGIGVLLLEYLFFSFTLYKG